jgi:hypothetical protein
LAAGPAGPDDLPAKDTFHVLQRLRLLQIHPWSTNAARRQRLPISGQARLPLSPELGAVCCVALLLSMRSGNRPDVTAVCVEEPRSGRFATADADLPSLSYGISSAAQRAQHGARNGPVGDSLLAGELASGSAKAAVCAGATRARLAFWIGLRPAVNARNTLTAGGASWQLSSGPVSKRPRVSEAEAPAEDGDVASELCNRPN